MRRALFIAVRTLNGHLPISHEKKLIEMHLTGFFAEQQAKMDLKCLAFFHIEMKRQLKTIVRGE